MQTVTVKNVVLGEGAPKIIVPLMGRDPASLMAETRAIADADFDVLEWRMDHFTHGPHASAPPGRSAPPPDVARTDALVPLLATALAGLRAAFPDTPLLATYRTRKEGGEGDLAADGYLALNRAIVETGHADMIDMELSTGGAALRQAVDHARRRGVRVIISSHDFTKTPSREEIISRLQSMQSLGADILKIALMPQSAADVLTLLSATEAMRALADRPFITISMGRMGVVSRLAGGVFGSCATFGTARTASAPGQIDAGELRRVLGFLHG